MKKLIVAALLSAVLAPVSTASPYFRPLNISKPVTVTGALIGVNPSDSEGAVMVPLFTHSPSDGCLLSKLGICEDWSPIAVGGAMNAGKVSLEVSPLFNVLPWMQQGALALIPSSWASVRAVLTPASGSNVTFSLGPTWEYQQTTNKGYYRTFTGLAMTW